jgi:two-component system, cell cycle sensor histidine kinase and response regulator CckA
MRETINEYLTGVGHQVFPASEGKEALGIAEQQPDIDVLVADIEMPEMSGIELWRRVRELIPGARVLFMSGHSDEILKNRDALPGPVISKPFNLPELEEKLRSM